MIRVLIQASVFVDHPQAETISTHEGQLHLHDGQGNLDVVYAPGHWEQAHVRPANSEQVGDEGTPYFTGAVTVDDVPHVHLVHKADAFTSKEMRSLREAVKRELSAISKQA
jgi:hypothetical protein